MSYRNLPPAYKLTRTIDMKTDRNLARLLNIVGTLIFVVIIGLGFLIKPFPYGFEFEFIHLAGLILGLLAYIFLHELTHALFMRLFLKERVRFGLHIWAAYAGVKDGYFNRREYLTIALAPVVILGISLTIMLIFATQGSAEDARWYWPLMVIQGQNIAGAIGDYYVAILLLKKDKATIVNDDGMSMRYYEPGPADETPAQADDFDFL